MRLLCLNANTTPFVTRTVSDEMRATLGDAVEVIDQTARFGPAVIKSRLDLAVATHGVVDAAAIAPRVDAIVLAVSFDTGRDALREALDCPVVGMSEASVAMARMLGRRIGYVSMGADLTSLYFETLEHCALDRDLAGWEALEAAAAYRDLAGWEALEAAAAYRAGDKSGVDALITVAVRSLTAKGADVVVLLGAVLAGAARRVQGACMVPVVDGGRAAALTARALIDLGAPKPKSGSYAARAGGLPHLCAGPRRLAGISDALTLLSQGSPQATTGSLD